MASLMKQTEKKKAAVKAGKTKAKAKGLNKVLKVANGVKVKGAKLKAKVLAEAPA